jgi:hypothetical protein
MNARGFTASRVVYNHIDAEKVCCKIYRHPSPFPLNQLQFSQLRGDGKVTVGDGKRRFCIPLAGTV